MRQQGETNFAISYDEAQKKIYFKLSESVLKNLGWKIGDYITAFHDQDNEKEIMIAKTSSGYKITKFDSNPESKIAQIRISWTGKTIFNKCKSIECDYTVEGVGNNRQLITLLPDSM